MSKAENIEERLRTLMRTVPEIEGSAVISSDGLMIASAFASRISEDRVAAMGAALLSVAERINTELEKGTMDLALIKGKEGNIILMYAGKEAILLCITTKEAKLGLLFYEMRKTAEEIMKMI